MNRQTELDFDRCFGAVPASFSNRIERTLANLEEEKTMKQRTISRALLIAALITILTLGTALAAANGTGLMNFFRNVSNMEPQEGAENAIARDLGWTAMDDAILTVREAVYDGAAVRVVTTLEARDKEKFVPVAKSEDDGTAVNVEAAQELAARSGRATLYAGAVSVACWNADVIGSVRAACYEDDVLVMYCECTLGGDKPEALEMCVSLDTEERGTDIIFTLPKAETVDSAYDVKDGAMEEITIRSASRRDTPFSSNLTFTYTSTAAGEALTWDKVDMTVYATPNGQFFHMKADCSGMQGAKAMKSSEAMDLGKTPCMSCAGRYPWENEECVVFLTDRGNFFHLAADCSGMQNAEACPARAVLEKGRNGCPICVGGSTQATEEHWLLKGKDFSLEFTTQSIPGGCYFVQNAEGWNYTVRGGDIAADDGSRTPFITLSMQRGLLGEDELTLIRLNENGEELGSAQLICAP